MGNEWVDYVLCMEPGFASSCAFYLCVCRIGGTDGGNRKIWGNYGQKPSVVGDYQSFWEERATLETSMLRLNQRT